MVAEKVRSLPKRRRYLYVICFTQASHTVQKGSKRENKESKTHLSLWPPAFSHAVSFRYITLATGCSDFCFCPCCFAQAQWYFQTSEALAGWVQTKSEDALLSLLAPQHCRHRLMSPHCLVLLHLQKVWFLQWWTERSQQLQCQGQAL